jgi:predicted small lipoprotein YifL
MDARPVSPWVGNVKNNDLSLIEPIAGGVRQGGLGGPMHWHRWLAALFVMLALAACAHGGPVPYGPYPPENVHDRGGDM